MKSATLSSKVEEEQKEYYDEVKPSVKSATLSIKVEEEQEEYYDEEDDKDEVLRGLPIAKKNILITLPKVALNADTADKDEEYYDEEDE